MREIYSSQLSLIRGEIRENVKGAIGRLHCVFFQDGEKLAFKISIQNLIFIPEQKLIKILQKICH